MMLAKRVIFLTSVRLINTMTSSAVGSRTLHTLNCCHRNRFWLKRRFVAGSARSISRDWEAGGSGVGVKRNSELIECSAAASEDSRGFTVIPDFVSAEEEQLLCQDITRTLRGKRYQYDHWDKAIEGYRETEKSQWSEQNQAVIDRLVKVTTTAVPGKLLTPLPAVHVLDLAADGYIKPHIDSVKFCGEVIAGISLLSQSVMQLQHEEDTAKWICALLPRYSLYIMQGTVRYRYTHAIAKAGDSFFRGEPINRDRRISVICRTLP